jgi:2-C-methyl-D-erythritol 4-phosphate cytidylyltransferase
MERSMVIVAGGSGTRMGSGLAKQFMELKGLPILMHTLIRFQSMDPEMKLILVLPASQFELWNELIRKHAFDVPHELAEGGATRFLSVKNGLAKVRTALVGIHDGVRPFVATSVVDNCFLKAERDGAAVPVIPIVQSLRKVSSAGNSAVDRNEFVAVQTPQCFRSELISSAFENSPHVEFSDDASVAEYAGHTIALVDGNAENIKITTPLDLKLAELLCG